MKEIAVKEYYPAEWVTREGGGTDDISVRQEFQRDYLIGRERFLRESRVLAMLQDGSAVLIIGFNELNTVVMNPGAEDGNYVYKVGMNDSREWFEQNGNRFITYVRNRN